MNESMPFQCPRCGSREIAESVTNKIYCRCCGLKFTDEQAVEASKKAQQFEDWVESQPWYKP